MRAYCLLQIATVLATVISWSPIAIVSVSAPCYAQSNASVTAGKKETLHVEEIKFDLGSKEAEQVAGKVTRIKRGDVYNRETVSSDLRSIYAALSVYRKAREAHTDWLGRLRAYPSTTVGGVRLTIKVVPFYSKPASISTIGAKLSSMEPIDQYSSPGAVRVSSLRDGWNYRMDNSEREEPHCRLGNTEKQRAKQLQDFLEEKRHCYPGYDSETNFW